MFGFFYFSQLLSFLFHQHSTRRRACCCRSICIHNPNWSKSIYYIMPEWLCSAASGFFALSSWPFSCRFINSSAQRLPKSFSTQSAATEFFKSSVSEPSNVFVFDHHRFVLQWLLLLLCSLWKGRICRAVTIQQRAAFWVSCCFPGSSQKGNQASQLFFLRVTSKLWIWLFLILNSLSQCQLCWSLCFFVKAGPWSNNRRSCCILSWVPRWGYICEQGSIFIQLNHFISVGERQLSKSGIGVAGKIQQEYLLRACFAGWMPLTLMETFPSVLSFMPLLVAAVRTASRFQN